MKKLVLAAVGALGLASASLAALPAAAQPLPLVKADYWCGPGRHLNAWNRCVPNAYFYGYWGGHVWGDRGHDREDFRFRDRDRGDFHDRGDFRGRGDFHGRGDSYDRGDFHDRGDQWR
jgi:hypothetical protein